MKIIVRILAGIAVLIGLTLLVALFVKNDYDVHREVVINKSKAHVFRYIKHLENQKDYNVWLMADPNAKTEGMGEQQIKTILEGERFETEIHFIRPFQGIAQTYLLTEGVGAEQTKVTWGMKGESNYPMNITNLFTGQMLGKDMVKSLENLKSVLEK
jgi:hypothetical protein